MYHPFSKISLFVFSEDSSNRCAKPVGFLRPKNGEMILPAKVCIKTPIKTKTYFYRRAFTDEFSGSAVISGDTNVTKNV
jgi:hypothetical protein